MGIIGGRVVRTPEAEKPYKVVLEQDGDDATWEQPVATVREGETLIRDKCPAAPEPEKMREWNAG